MYLGETENDFAFMSLEGQKCTVAKVRPGLPLEEARLHPAFEHHGRGWGQKLNIGNMLASGLARNLFIREHGFAMLTRETLDTLAGLLRGRVLEVGAGSGYLGAALAERGVDIVVSDLGGERYAAFGLGPVVRRDHEGDSLTLLPGEFDAVVMSWPHGRFAWEVASRMKPGQLLVYEGEGEGGATADEAFYAMLDESFEGQDAAERALNKHHVQFWGMHDRWWVLVKR